VKITLLVTLFKKELNIPLNTKDNSSTHNRLVVGSSPTGPTISLWFIPSDELKNYFHAAQCCAPNLYLLDRGPDSRRVMDLIMRLAQQAASAGGQVHQLLGNHEVMNLIGALRYVSDPAFTERECPA